MKKRWYGLLMHGMFGCFFLQGSRYAKVFPLRTIPIFVQEHVDAQQVSPDEPNLSVDERRVAYIQSSQEKAQAYRKKIEAARTKGFIVAVEQLQQVNGDQNNLEAICDYVWSLPCRKAKDGTWFEAHYLEANVIGEICTIRRSHRPQPHPYFCCYSYLPKISEKQIMRETLALKTAIDKVLQAEEAQAQKDRS